MRLANSSAAGLMPGNQGKVTIMPCTFSSPPAFLINGRSRLKGTIFTTLKPPAIGTLEIPFSAFFVTDNDWVGRGYFNYPPNDVTDVPITPGLTLRAAATAT